MGHSTTEKEKEGKEKEQRKKLTSIEA